MAGVFPGNGGADFRKGIKFAMDMAAAPLLEERAAFYFPAELVYNMGTDEDNTPFDPGSTVTREQRPPVRVSCAIEFHARSGEVLDFGTLNPSYVDVTLLDEDYVQVKGCSYMVLRGEKYNYESTNPPSGLFDVGLYVMRFAAETIT